MWDYLGEAQDMRHTQQCLFNVSREGLGSSASAHGFSRSQPLMFRACVSIFLRLVKHVPASEH